MYPFDIVRLLNRFRPLAQYERGFYAEEGNSTRFLYDRGGAQTLPDCFPNEPTEGINTTLPWQLEETFSMMQEDYWREKWYDPTAHFSAARKLNMFAAHLLTSVPSRSQASLRRPPLGLD